MTIVPIAIALLAGVSLLLGWYFRQLEAGAVKALPVWDRLSANVNRFVTDESAPDSLARDVTVYAAMAGCGCVAAQLIAHVVRKDVSKRYRKRLEATPLPSDLRGLSAGQKALLATILKDLVRIDLLRSPILRLITEKGLRGVLQGTIDAKARAEIKDIQSLMNVAHDAAERQTRHHKLPEKVAQLAELEPA